MDRVTPPSAPTFPACPAAWPAAWSTVAPVVSLFLRRAAQIAAVLMTLSAPVRAETPPSDASRRQLALACPEARKGPQRVFVLGRPTGPAIDVVVYFHGLHGYFRGDPREDALVATAISKAVADRGDLIAILPEALPGDADRLRANQRCVNRPGGMQALVDAALATLDTRDGPRRTVRRIAVIAHSGGGAMVGPALSPEGGRYAGLVTEVTLLDAGYNYRKSWEQARDWLIANPRDKVVRVLTGGDADAAHAVRFFATQTHNRPSPFAKLLTQAGLELTREELARMAIDSLQFEVLELTRGELDGQLMLRVGSAKAKGHYPIRDAGLPAATRSLGAGPAGWDLSAPGGEPRPELSRERP